MIYTLIQPGILNAADEIQLPDLDFSGMITSLALRAIDEGPTGGPLTVRIQEGTGPTPTNYIECVMAGGTTIGNAVTTVVGNLDYDTANDYYLRVYEVNGAQWLEATIGLSGTSTVAAGPQLTTLANVKESLKETTSTHDVLLQRIINGVSEKIERFTCRVIASQSVTEIADGNGLPVIVLREWPVISITSVSHESSFGVYDTAIPVAEYKNLASQGTLLHEIAWPDGVQNIEIVYTAGHVNIPPDIEQVCH